MNLGGKIFFALLLAQLVLAQTPQFTLDWYYNTGASVVGLSTVDLDFDGVDEILAASIDGHLYAIALNGSLVFRYYVTCPAYSVHATDSNLDEVPEILVGNCRHIEAINPIREEIWKYNAGLNTHKLASADLNLDGDLEILILARASSDRETKLIAINSTGSTLWSKRYTGTPVYDFIVGDFTSSKGLEIMTGSTKLQLYDSQGNLIKNSDLKTPIKSLYDGGDVISVGTLGGVFFFSPDGVLLNNDSSYSDIEDISAYKNGYLLASDKLIYHTGDGKKTVFETREPFTKVDVDDLDGYGGQEVVAGSNKAVILDEQGRLLWEYTPYRRVNEILITDLDGDGFKELIVASQDHNIYFIKQTSDSIKILDAEKLYTKAAEKHQQEKHSQALEDIEKAIGIVPKQKYYGLRDQIKQKLSEQITERKADEYLKDAKQLSSGPHPEKALLQASEALKLYRTINDTAKMTETRELLRWLSVETKTTTTSTTMSEPATGKTQKILLPAVGLLLSLLILTAIVLRHGISLKE